MKLNATVANLTSMSYVVTPQRGDSQRDREPRVNVSLLTEQKACGTSEHADPTLRYNALADLFTEIPGEFLYAREGGMNETIFHIDGQPFAISALTWVIFSVAIWFIGTHAETGTDSFPLANSVEQPDKYVERSRSILVASIVTKNVQVNPELRTKPSLEEKLMSATRIVTASAHSARGMIELELCVPKTCMT